MTEERAKRKLSGILSADAVGYSRLMQEDEISTIRTLEDSKRLISELIEQFKGRVVDAPGDNLLAEFGSVVDATECAVKIQKELKTKNAELPDNRRMDFRIGVNLGDVVEEADRIYGDGVNIAARIEALAQPGGICISRTAFDHVKNKLKIGYEYLGEHSVKNISEPVRVYRILLEPEAAGKVIGEKKPKSRRWIWAASGAISLIILMIGIFAIWNYYFRPSFEPASVEKMAFPLPEKPSIAVLPFDNMSGDPEQDYIADGFTENIITGLSQISEMFVIARNSVFTYKGKPVKIKQVSEELGVKYVLEGSIQKAGNRLRVNAQLIDATEGYHLWAERYDRELKDLFNLQDEITIKILKALRMKLIVGGEGDWVRTNSFEAWNHSVKGLSYSDRMTREDRQKAREHYEQALKLDPDYTLAWLLLAFTHVSDVTSGLSESPRDSFKRALEIEEKTSDSWPASFRHGFMNMIYVIRGQPEKAIIEGEKAVALDPNSPRNNIFLALALNAGARPEEAIVYAKKAMRLEPYYPAWFLGDVLAVSYDQAGRYEEGPAIGEKLLERALKGEYPLRKAYRRLALIYAYLDRMKEANAYAAEFRKIDPNFSVEKWRSSPKLSFFKDQKWLDNVAEMMLKAGIPEHPPLQLPDKPSIAVLPFVNMSGDNEQEYFSDGISEEIITALSKTPKLFVIARTSSFKYKGTEVGVRTVGRELGVRYVLEGSVRKAGDKVRITAQLIDATTDKHIWAERYDRDLKDIFAIQDEITFEIIKSMQVKLTKGDMAGVTGKGTKSLDGYLKALQAHEQFFLMNKQGSVKAKQLAKEAIDLDPDYAFPYTTLANAHMLDVWFKFSESPKDSMRQANEALQKALELDDSDPRVHISFCNLYTMQGTHDKALKSAKIAVELSPNGARAVLNLGSASLWVGQIEEAIHYYEQAIRLNPFPPGVYFRSLGRAYRLSGRYEDAITQCKKALQLNPDDIFTHLSLILAYTKLGREKEAKAEATEVLRIHPKFSIDHYAKTVPIKDQSILEDMKASLRKAGLE